MASDDALWLLCGTLLVAGFTPGFLLGIHEWRFQAGDSYADGELRVHQGIVEWTAQDEPALRWESGDVAGTRLVPVDSGCVLLLTPNAARESLVWELEGASCGPDLASQAASLVHPGGVVVFPVRSPLTRKSGEVWLALCPVGFMTAAILAIALDRTVWRSSSSYGMISWSVPLVVIFLVTFAVAAATVIEWCGRRFEHLSIGGGRLALSGDRLATVGRSDTPGAARGTLSVKVKATAGRGPTRQVQLALFSMDSRQLALVESCLRD